MRIQLSEQDKAILISWTRKATGENRKAQRAAIILNLAGGETAVATAAKLGIHRETVMNLRFHLHFVPTSCSWLNLVERFFAQITSSDPTGYV